MSKDAIVIPLTDDTIDRLALEAPDVDAHEDDYWIGYQTIMASPCAPPVQHVVPAAAFFERKWVVVDGTERPAWVCEGRAYRHGQLLSGGIMA